MVTAEELGLQRASDEMLLTRAKETFRLFPTRDKDFGALTFLQAQRSGGVILLRVTPMVLDDVHRELQRLLSQHREEELKGSFCVVEPHRHRIRRLPQTP